jgi:hypothetical protein
MKYKTLIILLHHWLHTQNQILLFGRASFTNFFPSLLAIENHQNHLFSIFPNFYFVFWRNFANKKKAVMNYDHGQKKETLHRSFKSANKWVELGLKWKNKPEDL